MLLEVSSVGRAHAHGQELIALLFQLANNATNNTTLHTIRFDHYESDFALSGGGWAARLFGVWLFGVRLFGVRLCGFFYSHFVRLHFAFTHLFHFAFTHLALTAGFALIIRTLCCRVVKGRTVPG